MRRFGCIALAGFLLAAAYGYGAASHKHRWIPTPQIERALRRAVWLVRPQRGFRDTSGRTRVDCTDLQSPRTAVLLTLGQSNAANEAEPAPIDTSGVYNFNFFDGRCYAAADPLLGTTGDGGSVWTHVARGLLDAGTFERIVLAPIAVGGSSIRRWIPGDGDLFARIPATQAGLVAAGLPPTHVLWHQGESDVRMSPDEYVRDFAALLAGIRDAGIEAPVWVAQASICKNRGSEALRAAQRHIAETLPGVRQGPNTDTLDRFVWRRDLCHFSSEGLVRHAALWVNALQR